MQERSDSRPMILAAIERVLARPPAEVALALANSRLSPGDPPNRQARLMILLSGRHRIAISAGDSEQAVDLTPATALHLAPGAWLRRHHGAAFRLLGLVFHPGYVRFLINTHRRGESPHPAAVWHHGGPLPAAGWQILNALADSAGLAPRVRPQLLFALLAMCGPVLMAGPAAGGPPPIFQAMLAYIEEHLQDPLDRHQLAQHFRIHPNHVSRLFAQHGHEGFARTLIRLRLERARILLRNPALSVAEVGRACGYTSPEYFVNEFRRHLGCSPGRMRLGG